MRTATRFPLVLHSVVETGTRQYSCSTANLSVSGVLFHFPQNLAIGSDIGFRVVVFADISGFGTDIYLCGTGKIVRCRATRDSWDVAATIEECQLLPPTKRA